MEHSPPTSLSEAIKSTKVVLGITAAVIAFASFIAQNFLNSLDEEAIIRPTISWVAAHGYSVALSIVLFIVCLIIVGIAFDWFWHKYVEPHLNSYKGVIAEEIKKNKESLERSLATFRTDSEELLKDNLLESVVVRSDSKYLKKNLKLIHEKAYGSHCGNEKGLHGAIRSKLYPFLSADRPHRSQHNQSITVTEVGGKAMWTEITRFELHAIALDDEYHTQDEDLANICVESSDDSELPSRYIMHDLKMTTGGNFINLKDMTLEVKIEDDVVADLQKMIDINSEDNSVAVKKDYEEILTIAHSKSGPISFSLTMPIKLTKAMTRVQITEKSFLDEKDNFYVIRRFEPSYGAVLSITIPDSWHITSFTVPNEKEWGYPNSIIDKNSPCRHVVADVNDWIMPGIIACCTWERTSH